MEIWCLALQQSRELNSVLFYFPSRTKLIIKETQNVPGQVRASATGYVKFRDMNGYYESQSHGTNVQSLNTLGRKKRSRNSVWLHLQGLSLNSAFFSSVLDVSECREKDGLCDRKLFVNIIYLARLPCREVDATLTSSFHSPIRAVMHTSVPRGLIETINIEEDQWLDGLFSVLPPSLSELMTESSTRSLWLWLLKLKVALYSSFLLWVEICSSR